MKTRIIDEIGVTESMLIHAMMTKDGQGSSHTLRIGHVTQNKVGARFTAGLLIIMYVVLSLYKRSYRTIEVPICALF